MCSRASPRVYSAMIGVAPLVSPTSPMRVRPSYSSATARIRSMKARFSGRFLEWTWRCMS